MDVGLHGDVEINPNLAKPSHGEQANRHTAASIPTVLVSARAAVVCTGVMVTNSHLQMCLKWWRQHIENKGGVACGACPAWTSNAHGFEVRVCLPADITGQNNAPLPLDARTAAAVVSVVDSAADEIRTVTHM